MRRIAHSLLLSLAVATPGLAQGLMPGSEGPLPQIPPASELGDNHVGAHYELQRESPETPGERVFFAGVSPEGKAVAFSLSDTPTNRKTFADTLRYCAVKGERWRMPTLHELRMVTRFSNEPDVDYLPGSYWTSTPAPCYDCNAPESYKMAYDIRTGNVRNNYDAPIFKNYPLCAYDIP